MKNIILCLIFGILSQTTFSQDLLWEHFYGGPNNDLAHHLIFTNDGGFVTIGYTESFGTGIWGKPDMWLCNFDEDGQMLWDKTYGQPDSLDKAYFGVKVDDGYLLVGERMEDIVYGNGLSGVIVKADFEGNEIWSKRYKGDNKDMLRHIQPVPSGGFIACGATRSNGAGFIDGWAVKLDEDCNIEWQANYGGADYEVFKQIYPTTDGGFMAGGFSNSDGLGSYDIWFVKMDSFGNLEWEQRLGNEFSNRLNYFMPTSDGNYIATGRSQKDSQELDELFAIKISPDAEIIWEQFYPATVEGEGYYIEEVLYGGYIIAGADANSIGGPWQTDGWVLRINDTGDLLWDYFTHGDASDLFYVARQNAAGDIIAAGGNMSHGAGMNDLWLTKLSDSTYVTGFDVSANTVETPDVSVFPNPTNGIINLNLTGFGNEKPNRFSKPVRFHIADITGKTVRTGEYSHSYVPMQIDLSNIEKGIYFIQVITRSDIYTRKIVVE